MAATVAGGPSASSSCSCRLAAPRRPAGVSPKVAFRRRPPQAFATPRIRAGLAEEDGGLEDARTLETGAGGLKLTPAVIFAGRKPLSITDLSGSVEGSPLRVAYQGVPGAYSESAAAKAYPNCEAVPCELFETAFDAVERFLVDRAVLPIENSLGGSIHRNYDLLLKYNLHIVGEVYFAVRHCLLANHGVEINSLRRVLSHPQALAQCEQTLTKLGVVRESADDTAGAAQYVATHMLLDTGAVASSRAAAIYGLNILCRDIQDDPDNITRFLMLAREPIIPGIDRPFKTSIVFSLEEGPGVLFKALAVFSMREINLTKIESRPLRKKPLRVSDDGSNGSQKYFDYLFYVDFEASMASLHAQNALRHLKEIATFLRILGSYPKDISQT
ncbi:unnamed protein product [Spirodela intermedia]|uniref:Arogenate dehydratase n=1 Tax=Spirodela intermedia TaxID=51605 RepID=A0A7I8JHD2_SPIIN|nr:unnamed protein product [Spirodela intermedia]CAA6669331.1 unnamed protein product [Spirodela intermedia]